MLPLLKTEEKYLFYGILFLFVYNRLFIICNDLISSLILVCQWNAYLVPIALLLLCTIFLLFFLKLKDYPKINFWLIIGVILVPIAINFFMLPNRYYFYYSAEDQKMLFDCRILINGINTYILVFIVYFKYYRLNKQLKK
jgi:energy-coupling factor transporter transmembrane protein EcfT